jgi:chromosome segregation protein
MSYIKKIELKGFKSFSSKTSIILDKGFTVLTGPNGSGKTNIVDAILFGLGELSSRRLRSENFAKLTFSGAPDTKIVKAKAAKVVIQFDNSKNRIPVETKTVTISREIRQSGQSIYRFNGRRSTRSRINDMLSMAGISAAGHNVVMQGTITRIAEISPVERRKIVEDLIGLSNYDEQKVDAEEKLGKAEISIQTAMGRVEEVQKRVEDLERERNDFLRHTFIENEIRRLKAIKISNEIYETEKKVEDIHSRLEKLRSSAEKLKDSRENLRSARHEIESKWRRYSSELVDGEGIRILEVQMKIGDIKSKLAELTTKIETGTVSLDRLKKVKENTIQQLESAKKDEAITREKIKLLKHERDSLLKEIEVNRSKHGDLSEEIVQIRVDSGENSEKLRENELKLNDYYQSLMAQRADYARSQVTIDVLSKRMEEHRLRRKNLASVLKELQKSIKDLKDVREQQKQGLKNIQQSLDSKIGQKQSIENDVAEAVKIVASARDAVVEFATQRKMAERVATEEKALRKIEELGKLGVIEGINGRLRNLIKIKKRYTRAIEATAVGWLDSIVVRDFNTALVCAETLRRLQLARIKIIPLKELSKSEPIRPLKIKGISGVSSSFIKYKTLYKPALIFVFGDTLIAEDYEAALTASSEGYRTVTLKGDLFEVGGGIESGYYRAPINFFSIIPSEPAVKSLEQAVSALKKHLEKRDIDIQTLEEELENSRLESVRRRESINILDNELQRVQTNIQQTMRDSKDIQGVIQKSSSRLEKEKKNLELSNTKFVTIKSEMEDIRIDLDRLLDKTNSSRIQEVEFEREKMNEEISELQQKLIVVETEFSTLQSKMEKVFKISSNNVKDQIDKVGGQLLNTEREVKEALKLRDKLKKELSETEEVKDEVSQTALKAKKSEKFTSRIDKIDEHLKGLDAEYEQTIRLLSQLQTDLQTSKLQVDQRFFQLKEIGCENPLEVLPEHLESADSLLSLMHLESARLGAVNQLALYHYSEQTSRYRDLSVRMNELEREKLAILSFMEEIEMEKRRVFMDSFNKINKSFSSYFSRLTDDGEADLKLENMKDPFAGGADMLVQFPGKPPIIVSGCSGGERSVAAIAFILAMQDFMPTSFYLFDEIDAHLDPFYVEKMAELLTEESDKSQFIVITLKPEMIGKAGKVYGVYEREGISQVVSTTFNKVV